MGMEENRGQIDFPRRWVGENFTFDVHVAIVD